MLIYLFKSHFHESKIHEDQKVLSLKTFLGEFCIISSVLFHLTHCFLNFNTMSIAEAISVAAVSAAVTSVES